MTWPDPLVEVLDQGKAEDIVVIDVRRHCDFTDHMVIASSGSGRKTRALAARLERTVKDLKRGPVGIEGLACANWVLIDVGDVVVHIFRPEVREFYRLEKLWTAADDGDGEKRRIAVVPD